MPFQNHGMPKLLAPVRSYEGAVRVIDAGADEVYCGVKMSGIDHFTLYRGPSFDIPTYKELNRIVDYAHHHEAQVFVTLNNPFMAEGMDKAIRNHIRLCIEQGIDAVIIGDMGVLALAKDVSRDIQLVASTYWLSMNYETVNFLHKLGFKRVILERHITLDEISEIVRQSKVEVEVFIHGGGCSNINGKCYLFHFDYPPLTEARHNWGEPCTIPFKIYDIHNEASMIARTSILDAFTFCSFCTLPELIQTGVAGLKIVGRGGTIAYQENTTRIYRELLDLVVQNRMEAYHRKVTALKQTFNASLRGPSIATLNDIACEKQRCVYASLFSTPYRIPESWRAWTKRQFRTLMVVE